MAGACWYVKRNGSVLGPLTWEALQRAARTGKVRPDDPVRREDETFWKSAAEARHDPAPAPQPHMRTIAEAAAAAMEQDRAVVAAEPETAPQPAPEPAARAETARLQNPVPAERAASGPESEQPKIPASPPTNKTGSALLAFLIGIIGLFGFGMFCGALAVAIAGGSLRDARGAGRVLAISAIVLGLVEVGLTAAALLQTGAALPRW
jgi:hypothetical protein